MSLFTFIKLCGKAFRFVVARPLQRFNIENRSKKYLGPEAKYFKPAPRAIGSMSLIDGKPPQYPYLESGRGVFKSIKQKRLQAIESKRDNLLESQKNLEPPIKLKSYSETEIDDRFVRAMANQLDVTKSVKTLETSRNHLLSEPQQTTEVTDSQDNSKIALAKPAPRPLPKSTNMQLQDPLSIWSIDKTPPGRLNLNMLQELMINKKADDNYWTPEKLSERYNIKEEYAEQLTKYCKQITIVVSPRLKNLLDYTGRDNPVYQMSKHVIYKVDKGLRDENDKIYDRMFLPGEQLDPQVREILDPQEEKSVAELEGKEYIAKRRQEYIAKRPAPLRLVSENKPASTKQRSKVQQLLETPSKED